VGVRVRVQVRVQVRVRASLVDALERGGRAPLAVGVVAQRAHPVRLVRVRVRVS